MRIKCLTQGHYCCCQEIQTGDLMIESLWSYPLSHNCSLTNNFCCYFWGLSFLTIVMMHQLKYIHRWTVSHYQCIITSRCKLQSKKITKLSWSFICSFILSLIHSFIERWLINNSESSTDPQVCFWLFPNKTWIITFLYWQAMHYGNNNNQLSCTVA